MRLAGFRDQQTFWVVGRAGAPPEAAQAEQGEREIVRRGGGGYVCGSVPSFNVSGLFAECTANPALFLCRQMATSQEKADLMVLTAGGEKLVPAAETPYSSIPLSLSQSVSLSLSLST